MTTLALQVAENADDGQVDEFVESFSSSANPVVGRNLDSKISAWFRFAGFSLPHGSLVNSAVVELHAYGATIGSPLTRIVAQRGAAAPSAPTSYADYWARDRTTAAVAWNGGALSTSVWTALPDLADVVRELVVDRTVTAILLFVENQQQASTQDIHFPRGVDAYGADKGGKLTIDYSAPTFVFDNRHRITRGPNVRAR